MTTPNSTVKAIIPTEPTIYNFFPTKDFYCEELKCQYLGGKKYSVREGNDKLHELVQEWKTLNYVTTNEEDDEE